MKQTDFISIIALVGWLGLAAMMIFSLPNPSSPPATPTPTAWVKQDILIEVAPGLGLDIWTDNAEIDSIKVAKIDGVIDIWIMNNGHMIYARIDPRYDKSQVAKEILRELKGGDAIIKK